YLQVYAQAGQQVRVLGSETVSLGQVRNHGPHGILSGLVEIRPDSRGTVPPSLIDTRDKRAGCGERWGQDAPYPLARGAQRSVHRSLDTGDTHLAIALRGVGVAAAEQRPLDLHREIERGAARELPGVHVPTEDSWRHHRLLACSSRTDTHRAEEGLDRNRDIVAQVR